MNKILYLDTNALIYAWKVGGTELLNAYKAYAELSGFKVLITDVVRQEIRSGPLRIELGNWLAEQSISPQITEEGSLFKAYEEARRTGQPTGDYNPKNAGERSISEVAGKAKSAGLDVKVFSDDKWFSNQKSLKPYGLTPEICLNNADMLNHSAVSGKVSPEAFEGFKAGFKTQPPYNASSNSYSQRLDRFISVEELASVRSGGSLARAIIPKLGYGLKVLGVAAIVYDVGTSSAEAVEAVKAGNPDKAANILARLAARIYFGFEAGVAGAALGGAIGAPGGFTAVAGMIVGGIAGAVAGAVAGDTAVNAIWEMSDRVISYLQGSKLSQETPAEAGVVLPTPLARGGEVYQKLVAAGIPSEQAHRIADIFTADYKKRVVSGISISANDLIAEIINSAKANQAILEIDGNGTLVTHISGPQMENTVAIDADDKARKSKLNPDGSGTEVRFDERGRSFEQTSFSLTSTVFTRYAVETGSKVLEASYGSGSILLSVAMDASGVYKIFSPVYRNNNFVLDLGNYSLQNLGQVWADFIDPLYKSGDNSLAITIEKVVWKTLAEKFPEGFNKESGKFWSATIDRATELSVDRGVIVVDNNGSRTLLKFDPSTGKPLERKDYYIDNNLRLVTTYSTNSNDAFNWKTDFFRNNWGLTYISDTEVFRKDGYYEIIYYDTDGSWLETNLYDPSGRYITTLNTAEVNPPPAIPRPVSSALITDPRAPITFSMKTFVNDSIQSRLGLTTEHIGRLNASEIRAAVQRLRYDQIIPFLAMLSPGQISAVFPSRGGSGVPVPGGFINLTSATVTIVDGGVAPIPGTMTVSALFNYTNNVYQYTDVTAPSIPIVVPPLPDIPPIVITPPTQEPVFVILSSISINGMDAGCWAYPNGTFSTLILYPHDQPPQHSMTSEEFEANPPWK